MQNDIESYQSIKENLTSAKGITEIASEVGNTVYEDLTEMKSLITSYYNTADSEDDSAARSEIAAKFENTQNQPGRLYRQHQVRWNTGAQRDNSRQY
jgi:flagellin-like hook-associated protein FlgL